MNTFIFVRHGQSKANAEGFIADAHAPLTEAGIEQARITAGKVKDLDVEFIVCSPYLRAQQTAETIAGELGIDFAHIRILDKLHERDLGMLENKPKEHEGTWYFIDDSSEGIESRINLFMRMRECLEEIVCLSMQGKVLAVGHAISGFYLMQIAANKENVESFDSPALMNNADFIEIEISDQ